MHKLNSLSKKCILFFLVVAVFIISITTITYAYWGGDTFQEITGTHRPNISIDENITSRYMIFRAILEGEDNYYLRYNDDGYFQPYNMYNEGLNSTITATQIENVELVLYQGALGEFEEIVVPDSINIKIGTGENNTKNCLVTVIDLRMAEMFNSKDLIKKVTIGANVTEIKGASFSSCNNLQEVKFLSATQPTISQHSFINPEPNFKNSSNQIITITRS